MRQIEKYKRNGIIAEKDKYILAINTSEATGGFDSIHQAGVCLTTAVVLNIGHWNLYLCPKTNTLKDAGFEECTGVCKSNGSRVEFNFFKDKNLIGVISDNATLWDIVINNHDFNYIVNNNDRLHHDMFDNVTALIQSDKKTTIKKLKQVGDNK